MERSILVLLLSAVSVYWGHFPIQSRQTCTTKLASSELSDAVQICRIWGPNRPQLTRIEGQKSIPGAPAREKGERAALHPRRAALPLLAPPPPPSPAVSAVIPEIVYLISLHGLKITAHGVEARNGQRAVSRNFRCAESSSPAPSSFALRTGRQELTLLNVLFGNGVGAASPALSSVTRRTCVTRVKSYTSS